MSSIMPPQPDRSPFAAARSRREPLLGALLTADWYTDALVAGLDFVVLAGPVSLEVLSRLRALAVPVLMMVESDAEVSVARDAGFEATVTARPAVTGADISFSDRGPARLVASVAAARAAFAGGADLVVYDLPGMLGTLTSDLATGRPAVTPGSVREPLVLLSGMLGDSSLWDDVAADLADRVLPWPARIDRDDSIVELAATVLAEAPPRFALAGHSLGAIVALEIVRQAPQRVSRLALVNASGRGPSPAQLQAWQQWRQRTLDGGFDAIAGELARATIAPDRRDDAGLIERNAGMARTVGAAGLLRQLAAQAGRPDSLGSVGAIDVPVLIVSGERDEICPPALQAELAGRCARAQHATIAGAGHMVPLEAPTALAAELRNWLEREVQ